jgi:endoglucanase
MKEYFFLAAILLMSALLFSSISFAQEKDSTQLRKWWEERYPGVPQTHKNEKLLPLIQVKGNRFVNSKGDTVFFHGLAIADPDKIEYEGHWNKKLFDRAKALGAMIIRIPVHPIAWRERTSSGYLALLDQAVEWCTQDSLYIDIDWHSIGNLEQGLFQDPMYQTSMAETFNFWRTIAWHFSGNNTIAFYELFNEPTLYRGQLGDMTWEQWKKINEDLIKLIRAYDPETIPLVAGFDWAYDLTPLRDNPVDAKGIAYSVHPYPHKRTPPYIPKWEEDFGFAADKYPVVATELGFTLTNNKDNIAYGKTIIKYFKEKGISWIWWVFDPEWGPRMFESWKNFKLTENGRFFEEAAHGEIIVNDSTATFH